MCIGYIQSGHGKGPMDGVGGNIKSLIKITRAWPLEEIHQKHMPCICDANTLNMQCIYNE